MSSLVEFDKLDLASTPNTLPADLNRPPPAALSPIPTAQLARVIQRVHTELLVQVFGDRIFVVITQLGRIGALVSQHHWVDCDSAELEGWIEPAGWVGKIQVNPPPSSIPSPISSASTSLFPTLPPIHPATTLLPLFGAPPSPHAALLHDLYAHQAAAICWQATKEGYPRRPVLLGVALKRGVGEEEDGEEGVTEAERECFGEVMGMVEEACRRVGLGRED